MENLGDDTRNDENDVPDTSTQKIDNNRASSNAATFRKLKKRVKKRSYRRKSVSAEAGEANSGLSNVNPNITPGGSTLADETPEIIQKPKKARRSYVGDDGTDDSDSESKANNNEKAGEAGETSEEWTTVSEEEEYTAPMMLGGFKPKPTFSIAREALRRQVGQSVNFQTRYYGSVHTVECLRILHSLEGHKGCVNTVEFNENGELLASGSDDLSVCIWNWTTGVKCNSYKSGHRNNVFQASWMPCDKSTMVTCASDGQVRLLNLVRGTTTKLTAHGGSCNKFATHPDTPHVAVSVGDDGRILSTDIREGGTTKLGTMKRKACAVKLYTIHANPRKSHELCIGGYSEMIKIFDRRRPRKPLVKLCPSKLMSNDHVNVTAVTYNHDGSEILASYNDDDIYLFDTLIPHPNGDYAHRYKGHRNYKTIKGVNFFGPKSEYIVSGSDCGNIFFWDKNTETIVQCARGDIQGVVNCVKPHPSVPVLASSGLDDDVKIWMPSVHRPLSSTQRKMCVTANLTGRAEDRLNLETHYAGDLFCIIVEQFWHNRDIFANVPGRRTNGTLADDEYDGDDD